MYGWYFHSEKLQYGPDKDRWYSSDGREREENVSFSSFFLAFLHPYFPLFFLFFFLSCRLPRQFIMGKKDAKNGGKFFRIVPSILLLRQMPLGNVADLNV